MHLTEDEKERAILVAVTSQKQTPEQTKEYLDELEFLALTAGIITLKQFTQKLEKPDLATYVGKGRFEDIIAYVKDNSIDIILYGR